MSNRAILKNTIVLFIRTIFILCINLYTSRIVLEVLGATDYGIYNVVAGVVAMLSFLNSALVQASQRYLCISHGQKIEISLLKETFSTSFFIHLTIAIIVAIILETLGLWYVNNIMVFPSTKQPAVNIIYQLSILIFILRIMIVPYTASVVAREDFQVYAYISIIDAVLQLIGIVLLKQIHYDQLITYVGILTLVAIIHYLLYFGYCRHEYKECQLILIKNWTLYREMFKYSSWAFLGGFGYVARTQGVNLVLNFYCGPTINAARGLATQVSGAVQTLVASFQQAMNPQIIKQYAKDEKSKMIELIHMGAKYSFLLLLIIFTPILIRPTYVLSLWLVDVPDYTAQFLIMAIVMCLVISLTGPLVTGLQATGNIKLFQIIVSLLMCADIPLAALLLKIGIIPWLVTGVSIVTALCCLTVELMLLKSMVGLNIYIFFKSIIIRCLIIVIYGISVLFIISWFLPNNFIGLILLSLVDIIFYGVIISLIALNQNEKVIAKQFFMMKWNNIRHTIK